MTSRLSRRIGIFLIVVVTLLIGSSVLAQGGPFGATSNPWAQVNAKLDRILNALSAEPESQLITLHTGVLFKSDADTPACSFLNVGTSELAVAFKMRRGSTVVVQGSAPVNPGTGFTALGTNADGSAGSHRCEFSFEGFPHDVRANIQVLSTSATAAVLEAR